MLDFNYYAPTYLEFGKDKEKEVGNLVKRFGGSRILLHYGSGSAIKNGLLDRVKSYLNDSDIEFVELGGVVSNPVSDLVYEGINLCRDKDIDFVLAIGGGSVIDSAKAIAAGVVYDGDFWDFFRNNDRVTIEKSLPVGVVLTIAAAGSESSNSIVITNSETRDKRGNIRCDIVRPKFAIMNPCLTMTLSNYQTACGVVDIMTHVIERYFSNTRGCVVTDRLCEAILKSMLECGVKVIDNPDSYEVRSNIMWAGTLAHNNLCGVDREQDWASHKIEHELSGKYGIAHGAGLAVVVIRWMRYVSKINPNKFISFNKNVFDIDSDDVDVGINKLEEYWINLGMPSSLEELGYKEEDLNYLVNNIDYTKEGTIGSYVNLTRDDIKKIYRDI